ncbi:hypothetical protein, partial [Legionella feeleii]
AFNEMERKLNDAFTALEEQTASLSTTIAQLGIEAGKLHSQVTRLEGMVKQLQEQQEKMLATTGKLNDAGEKLSQEIDSLSAIITEKKAAMDFISESIVSIVSEVTSVKSDTITTKLLTEEESTQTKRQVKKCQELEMDIDKSVLKVKAVNTLLDDSLDKADKTLNDSRSISLKERALKAIALKQRTSAQEDSQGDSPAISVPR